MAGPIVHCLCLFRSCSTIDLAWSLKRIAGEGNSAETQENNMNVCTATESLPGARGMIFIHSTPVALCPHLEWAAASVLGAGLS